MCRTLACTEGSGSDFTVRVGAKWRIRFTRVSPARCARISRFVREGMEVSGIPNVASLGSNLEVG